MPYITQSLRQSYLDSCTRQESCALVIVTRTQGSTYARVGSRMLVGATGWSLGIVGGGCFDQELIAKAIDCLNNHTSMEVYFDLRKPGDGVFGSGQGCEGLTQVWIGPISLLLHYYDLDRILHKEFIVETSENELIFPVTAKSEVIFKERIRASKRLIIVGRGEDVIPLAQIAISLNWLTAIVDPRPIKQVVASACIGAHCYTSNIAEYFNSSGQQSRVDDAVVLMSHDMSIDALSMETAAESKASYIGLLGPVSRREKILGIIDQRKLSKLQNRLFAPCGKRLITKEPAIIALAICNEIAEHFNNLNTKESNETSNR